MVKGLVNNKGEDSDIYRMEQKRWFILANETVKGPYTTDRVEHLLKDNAISDETLVWWKGNNDWIPLKIWKQNLDQIMTTFKPNIEKSVWYLDIEGSQQGPYYFDEVKDFFKKNKTSCKLWTAGMTDWLRPHEIPDFLEHIGFLQRKHFRAPIKGDIILQKNGVHFSLKAASISEGGLGFKDHNGLNSGDIVTITLKSPLLISPITSRAKILYTSHNGNTGLQFLNLQPENHSNIITYIKQFQTTAAIL